MNTIIQKAIDFAKLKHKGQKDDAGVDYFFHLEEVARILQIITVDPDVIAAGYLHDTLEDTQTTQEELICEFGDYITRLVCAVTHDGKKDEKGFYFPRLNPSLENRDAILIKFADRLSNLSRMQLWSDERKKHYLKRSVFWKID